MIFNSEKKYMRDLRKARAQALKDKAKLEKYQLQLDRKKGLKSARRGNLSKSDLAILRRFKENQRQAIRNRQEKIKKGLTFISKLGKEIGKDISKVGSVANKTLCKPKKRRKKRYY